MKKSTWKILPLAAILLGLPIKNTAKASPETIKAGILYYADEYTVKDNVAELGEEKNYEEVFKNYNYYEAAYDEQKRMILFRAYKKGEVEWEERYSYHQEGGLAVKKTIVPGKPERTENFSHQKNKDNLK